MNKLLLLIVFLFLTGLGTMGLSVFGLMIEGQPILGFAIFILGWILVELSMITSMIWAGWWLGNRLCEDEI